MKDKPQPVVERRFTCGAVEFREAAAEGGPRKVRGYAAMFNKRSENMGWGSYELHEVIERGAFDDVLKDDVRALFNHDANLILARSKGGKGTLEIGVDDTGLWYEFTPPDTQAGRDLAESLKRGDVDQSSFAFTVGKDGQKWEETREGDSVKVLRTITKVARLYDVSPVTYPAYADTTVAMRDFETFQREHEQKPEPVATKTPERDLWAARLGISS
jgi:HK97 family phage prohead protease